MLLGPRFTKILTSFPDVSKLLIYSYFLKFFGVIFEGFFMRIFVSPVVYVNLSCVTFAKFALSCII